MEKTCILLALALAAGSCAPKVTVTVENPSMFARTTELVEIPVAELQAVELGEGQAYVVKNGGAVVTSQVTGDGLLLFQSGLEAGGKSDFTVSAGQPQEFKTKTYGRFAAERYDDFIWENDRVAFRIYGHALMEVDGPSNGIDALYKRSEDMVLDEWYRNSLENNISYHYDHGTGLDDYKVGRTLGAGAMAPRIWRGLLLNENFRSYEIMENGPLRTTFCLTYPDIEVGSDVWVEETRTISIDAGSQMSRITQAYRVDEPIKVAAGFPLRIKFADHAHLIYYWYDLKPLFDVIDYKSGENWFELTEPATDKTTGVSLGLVMPEGMSDLDIFATHYYNPSTGNKVAETMHILALTTYEPGKPITYYTGFGWEQWWKQPEKDFAEYLQNFSAALKEPFVVTYK